MEGQKNMCLIDIYRNLFLVGSQSGLRHVTVHKMKEELFRKLEELAPLLPTNSLDQLIDGLGGPTKVSEVN